MTQEQKQLLLKDLCARLPYGVKVRISSESDGCLHAYATTLDIDNLHKYILDGGYYNHGHFYKTPRFQSFPYLRPMSSMTEEERKEFSVFIGKTETYVQQICLDADSMANPIIGGYQCVYWGLFDRCIDWLNKKMFDYRGLIEKGLALESPEGMYKTE